MISLNCNLDKIIEFELSQYVTELIVPSMLFLFPGIDGEAEGILGVG